MGTSPLAVRVWNLLRLGGRYSLDEVKRLTQAGSKAALDRALAELEDENLITIDIEED